MEFVLYGHEIAIVNIFIHHTTGKQCKVRPKITPKIQFGGKLGYDVLNIISKDRIEITEWQKWGLAPK